jgi:hypothetical protein
MFTRQKNENIAKNNKRLRIKLALIYFLLVLLFISLLILL